MIRKYLVICLIVATFPTRNYAQSNKSNIPYSIDSIQAFLYYETKGIFSKEINDDFILWNTVIGEGSAEYPSNSTFVKVKISRKFDEGSFYRKIRLSASLDGKVVLKQTTDFSLYDDKFSYYAGFWLYDTGCGQLKLVAELIEEMNVQGKVNQKVEAKRERILPFNCGE